VCPRLRKFLTNTTICTRYRRQLARCETQTGNNGDFSGGRESAASVIWPAAAAGVHISGGGGRLVGLLQAMHRQALHGSSSSQPRERLLCSSTDQLVPCSCTRSTEYTVLRRGRREMMHRGWPRFEQSRHAGRVPCL
jgi:hypothetical protein